MNLEFKPDASAAIDRWRRFWIGENERPLLHAIRPKEGVTPIEKPRPYDCAFGDMDHVIDQTLGWAATHDFLGDAIPSFMVTFAPDHFAALLGAEIKRNEKSQTNWADHCLTKLEGAEFKFDRDAFWWKKTVECVERFREKCDGKLIITGTHLQGSLDCLAAMYGVQETLLEMAMEPELVEEALVSIDRALVEVRKAFSEILDIPKYGSLNRFGMYSDGVIDVPQCDLSCMISSDMFAEVELPHLKREIESVDHSIYHLDGPDALQHTESVCSIDSLDMIQWMPGEGYYDDDWSDLNERIDGLGKGQIFQSYYKMDCEDVLRIWDGYSSRKLYFQVTASQCEELLSEFEGEGYRSRA